MNRLPTLPKDCKNLGDEIVVVGLDSVGQRMTVSEALTFAATQKAELVHLASPRPGIVIFRLVDDALQKKLRRRKE
jgi:hypothetical protein